jgi:hypothetical protein
VIRKCIAQYPELGYQVLDVAKVVFLSLKLDSDFHCSCVDIMSCSHALLTEHFECHGTLVIKLIEPKILEASDK